MLTETGYDSQHQAQQIEALLSEIQASPDTKIRDKSLALIQALMDFHSTGIDRMMEIVAESGQVSPIIFDKFANDDLISSLLLLYGLHPHELSERVEKALNKIHPYVRSQGGSINLVHLNNDTVTLVLDYNHQGNASSAAALKKAVEESFYESAPDAAEIRIEEINRPTYLAFVPLTSLRKSDAASVTK
jgi:Fe-S cluster biogenesis protein NfuA